MEEKDGGNQSRSSHVNDRGKICLYNSLKVRGRSKSLYMYLLRLESRSTFTYLGKYSRVPNRSAGLNKRAGGKKS